MIIVGLALIALAKGRTSRVGVDGAREFADVFAGANAAPYVRQQSRSCLWQLLFRCGVSGFRGADYGVLLGGGLIDAQHIDGVDTCAAKHRGTEYRGASKRLT